MKRAGRAIIFELGDMIGSANVQTQGRVYTSENTFRVGWVRAVPEPFYDGLLARLRSAWEVVCGRAYPVRWPQAGELEKALSK